MEEEPVLLTEIELRVFLSQRKQFNQHHSRFGPSLSQVSLT